MSLSTRRARFSLPLAQAIMTTWDSHDNSASVDKTTLRFGVGLGRSELMMLTAKSSFNHPGVQLWTTVKLISNGSAEMLGFFYILVHDCIYIVFPITRYWFVFISVHYETIHEIIIIHQTEQFVAVLQLLAQTTLKLSLVFLLRTPQHQ